MLQAQYNLFHIPIIELIERIKLHFSNYFYDFKTHRIVLENNLNDTLGYIRLPLNWCVDDAFNVRQEEDKCVLYLTIESGNAAICITEGEHLIYHTTFSAYMTRKKQGFSQIKYLKKKGKSRAGSRVRLAEGEVFFENINTTLTDLFEEFYFQRIALNCTPTLLPFLFSCDVSCPFDKKDGRLYKIPLHLPQSNFENLNGAIKKLKAPVLFYDVLFEKELNPLFKWFS